MTDLTRAEQIETIAALVDAMLAPGVTETERRAAWRALADVATDAARGEYGGTNE